MMNIFHLGLKERKMSSRPELDLKNFQELRLDLFKKVLHIIRVLDQGINRSRESRSFIRRSWLVTRVDCGC
jgi:hypothetical protein